MKIWRLKCVTPLEVMSWIGEGLLSKEVKDHVRSYDANVQDVLILI